MDEIEVEGVVATTPERIFNAWLDGEGHTAMTGSPATCEQGIGGLFTAWGGYITGSTRELEPYRRIVQAWRTSQFPEDAPHSRLEVLLEPVAEGTRVVFRHSQIPTGQGVLYEAGWVTHYIEPMQAWARTQPGEREASPHAGFHGREDDQ
jgi:uncharacterized protein YndB with AHSA1/START domain